MGGFGTGCASSMLQFDHGRRFPGFAIGSILPFLGQGIPNVGSPCRFNDGYVALSSYSSGTGAYHHGASLYWGITLFGIPHRQGKDQEVSSCRLCSKTLCGPCGVRERDITHNEWGGPSP